MPQLTDFSVFSSLIFWSLLSFGVLLFALKKYAFPPIMEMLEEREKKISGDIKSAESLRAEAQELKNDYEKQLKTAHEKADTIVQLATEEAKKVQEKTLQETQAKSRQIKNDAEAEIAMNRNKLLAEVRGFAAELTIASTERIIKKSLDNSDKQRLVESSIEEVMQEMKQRSMN
ncbi:MAG: F0F1 ATP synthase subunit B [Nitrospinales bacterium]